MGINEFSSTALVAVVVCTPVYTSELNAVMPKSDSARIRPRHCHSSARSRQAWRSENGASKAKAISQRMKESVIGGTAACMARARTKLPDQNSAVSTSST